MLVFCRLGGRHKRVKTYGPYDAKNCNTNGDLNPSSRHCSVVFQPAEAQKSHDGKDGSRIHTGAHVSARLLHLYVIEGYWQRSSPKTGVRPIHPMLERPTMMLPLSRGSRAKCWTCTAPQLCEGRSEERRVGKECRSR